MLSVQNYKQNLKYGGRPSMLINPSVPWLGNDRVSDQRSARELRASLARKTRNAHSHATFTYTTCTHACNIHTHTRTHARHRHARTGMPCLPMISDKMMNRYLDFGTSSLIAAEWNLHFKQDWSWWIWSVLEVGMARYRLIANGRMLSALWFRKKSERLGCISCSIAFSVGRPPIEFSSSQA